MSRCFNCEACLRCESKKGHCHCNKFKAYDNEMIKFGKYKGMAFKDLKETYPDYLLWVISSIPKQKIDNKLYDYIYVNRDDITSLASNKRRK